MQKIILLSLYLLLHSCAFAPISGPKSAATAEKGKSNMLVTLYPAPLLYINQYLKEDLELGIGGELQGGILVNAYLKYAFINNPEGFSLAVLGGPYAAYSVFVNSYGAFTGPMMSYKNDWFETYLSTRLNYIKWDGNDIDQDDNDDLIADFIKNIDTHFTYAQYELGFNIHFNDKFALNLNAKALHFYENLNSDIDNEFVFIPEAAAIVKF